ncbi:50S ribosomal protein L2 [Patescibacteria group bacterium]
MPFRKTKPTTPGRRFAKFLDTSGLSRQRPLRKKTSPLKKSGGRNNAGRVTVRHRGGGHKRFLREVDFSRRKKAGIVGKVTALEYDPGRGAYLALVVYADGEKTYILAPGGLKVGDKIVSGDSADFQVGNALPLGKIPVGTIVCNVELKVGRGGQIVRGAGSGAIILGKEEKWVVLKLPSGERRRFLPACWATIGALSNPDLKLVKLGKAGRRRRMGWRPAVRGVAMHPGAHPHGGGEGRSGIGMPSPKSPWGKKTLGKKTRKRKKSSDKLIVKRRK